MSTTTKHDRRTDARRIAPLHDYRSGRELLLGLGEQAGARFDHHRHPLAGPDGAPIYTDVARFGADPGDAHTVVFIASGTHGVEGHAGWGLQRLLLAGGRLDDLPAGVAVVLIHAVNPYGMAWSRRVDHENVDVNRNFVDFAEPLPANPGYDDIDAILNPSGPSFDLGDDTWRADLLAYVDEVGALRAFRTISGGQYDRPHGMQFGGGGPTWSRRTLHDIWTSHVGSARRAFHLDIHTGLGPCGGLTVFQTADAEEVAAEVAARWFPVWRVDRTVDREPLQVGLLSPAFDAAMPADVLSVPIVVEFGTHADAVVLAAMRADNWLHQHGDPASALGEDIRAATRDAFFLEDESWREKVAEQGMAVIDAALDTAAERIDA